MEQNDLENRDEQVIARIRAILEQASAGKSRPSLTSDENLDDLLTIFEEQQQSHEEMRVINDQLNLANEVIEEERQRYRALFEMAPDGYLVTDQEGTILEANQVAASLFNLTLKYLMGKPLATFIPMDNRQGFRQILLNLRYLANKFQLTSTSSEIMLQPRGKAAFWATLTVAPQPKLFAGHHTETNLFWMIHDISDRKQAQVELQKAKDELEIRVEERTAQLRLVNEKLTQTAAQLLQKNQELQDFAFVASHDLQEPLRKIQAFGDRLRGLIGTKLDEEEKDLLERMIKAGGRMQAMITGLLDYARVTTRGKPSQTVDLQAIAQEVVSDLEMYILRSSGKVEVGDFPPASADPIQMQQLLQNLITNGLKFHKPGVAPEVKVWGETDGDGRVKIVVKDNGIGIDPKDHERLFQPFHRLQGRSEFEGSGMGLAICRKIVERHGGTISVDSTTGEGTRFTVMLPG